MAAASDVASVAGSVKINGNGAANIKSNFSKSKGDKPGDKRGLMSGTNDGKAEFIMGSFNVLIEGKPAVRQGDPMISNSKNTPPMPLAQSGGASPRGLSVEMRDSDTQSEDPAEAAFIVETDANNNLIGQGKFTVTQGAFKNNQVFDEGV